MNYPWTVGIVGLDVRRAGPVRDAYLPLGTGLHALYGRNGAGKTSILHAFKTPSHHSAMILRGRRMREWYEDVIRPTEMEEHFHDYLDGGWRPFSWQDAGLPPLGTTAEDLEAVAAEFARTDTFILDGRTLTPALPLEVGTPATTREATRTQRAVELTQGCDNEYAIEALDVGICVQDYFTSGIWGDDKSPFSYLDRPALAVLPHWSHNGPPSASVLMNRDGLGTLVIDDTEVDLDEVTRQSLTDDRTVGPSITGTAGFWESAAFTERCRVIEAAVNSLYATLLLEAPTLRLQQHEPHRWLSEGLLSWRAEAAPETVPVSALSAAQRRWATIAVKVTLRRLEQCHVVLVLDEPEAGLHRTAEAHCARGLAQVAAADHSLVVVATHSPEFLDAPAASLHHVHTPVGHEHATIVNLDAARLHELDVFGITPSDLLRRQKVFLLVEGTHDELVLTTLLKDELAAARVQVLPLRGAKQLASTIDSKFLFDYTDAHVVALVDNLSATHLQGIWDQALVAAAIEGPEAASAWLRSQLPAKEKSENKFLGEFLSAALHSGNTLDRVTPFGLQQPDVIMYLPVASFVPTARSWDQLIAQHAHDAKHVPFKTWLARSFGCTFDNASILRALEALGDEVPTELYDLLDLCQRVGQPDRRDS